MTPREESLLTIGQVIDRLKEVAPDLTVSKLHFYERQGLIQPARTRGGHRLYCPRTVERLQLILLLRQRAHLPLNMIASLLDALEKDPAMVFLLQEWLQSPLTQGAPITTVTEEEARQLSGLSPEVFRQIQELGLVHPCPVTGRYDPEAVIALQAIRDLFAMGLRLEDLLPYHIHVDQVLEHEKRLFQKVLSQHPPEGDPRKIYQGLQEALARFRRFLFLNHLRRVVEQALKDLEDFQHKQGG